MANFDYKRKYPISHLTLDTCLEDNCYKIIFSYTQLKKKNWIVENYILTIAEIRSCTKLLCIKTFSLQLKITYSVISQHKFHECVCV